MMSPEMRTNWSGFLELKGKQKQKATYIKVTERLMAEIETLRIVMGLVNRNNAYP
jgi:hypothetical protein